MLTVEIPRPHDATELNNDGMIKLGDVYYQYQTEPILSVFFKGGLTNDNSSFYSHILSAVDLQCQVFLLKSFCQMSVFVCKRHFWWRHIWRHPHVTLLQCWDKFSNDLVHWSVRMIRAKNYKTVTKFDKVMPRLLWPLSFLDTVYIRLVTI